MFMRGIITDNSLVLSALSLIKNCKYSITKKCLQNFQLVKEILSVQFSNLLAFNLIHLNFSQVTSKASNDVLNILTIKKENLGRKI